jgi:hypothetical protein
MLLRGGNGDLRLPDETDDRGRRCREQIKAAATFG